jgi:hypothetical protein
MRIAILDDIHNAYDATSGVHRLRDRAEVQIFTKPFGDPSVLRDFDALIANHDEMYSQFADAAADILLAYADGKEVPRFSAAH